MTVNDKNLNGSVAFEITSFIYFFCQVCDSLLNIGPSTCVDMGEPAFLSVSAELSYALHFKTLYWKLKRFLCCIPALFALILSAILCSQDTDNTNNLCCFIFFCVILLFFNWCLLQCHPSPSIGRGMCSFYQLVDMSVS